MERETPVGFQMEAERATRNAVCAHGMREPGFAARNAKVTATLFYNVL